MRIYIEKTSLRAPRLIWQAEVYIFESYQVYKYNNNLIMPIVRAYRCDVRPKTGSEGKFQAKSALAYMYLAPASLRRY